MGRQLPTNSLGGGGADPRVDSLERKLCHSYIKTNKFSFTPFFTGAYKYDIFDNATLNILSTYYFIFGQIKKIIQYHIL